MGKDLYLLAGAVNNQGTSASRLPHIEKIWENMGSSPNGYHHTKYGALWRRFINLCRFQGYSECSAVSEIPRPQRIVGNFPQKTVASH
jgi:hypothetical protein